MMTRARHTLLFVTLAFVPRQPLGVRAYFVLLPPSCLPASPSEPIRQTSI